MTKIRSAFKMRILFFLMINILFQGLFFSQNYAVFENNKKNKSLFDYGDPNSLVSLLVQNQNKINEYLRDEYIDNGFSNPASDNVFSSGLQFIRIKGQPIEVFLAESQINQILLKSGKSFDTWYDSLLNGPYVIRTMEGISDYDDLERMDKEMLRSAWNKSFEGMELIGPDGEAVYWIEIPKFSMYLKQSIKSKDDTLINSKEDANERVIKSILITEKLEAASGLSEFYNWLVPSVIMAFGSEYDGYLSLEIQKLLQEELEDLHIQISPEWKKTLDNKKGRYKSNDYIKTIINCNAVDNNGIYFRED